MHERQEPLTEQLTESGCHVMAASSCAQAFSLAMKALPAPPSSPGQPKKTTVPGLPERSR